MLIGIESSHPGLFLLLNSLVNPHQQSMHALCLNPLILRDLPRSYSPHIWPSWVGLQWNSALDSQGSYYDPQGLIWLNHNNWFCQWGTQIVPLCSEINLSGFFAMDSATTMCLDYSVLSGGFGQFLYCWLVYIYPLLEFDVMNYGNPYLRSFCVYLQIVNAWLQFQIRGLWL